MDQVDLRLRRLDPRLRLLLEGVEHPDVVIDLQRVDHPERIAPVLQRQLQVVEIFPGALDPADRTRVTYRTWVVLSYLTTQVKRIKYSG
jgi:hypothetical protein